MRRRSGSEEPSLGSNALIISAEKLHHEQLSVPAVSVSASEPDLMMVRWDLRRDKSVACRLIYRSDVVPKNVQAMVATIKTKRTIEFVNWLPTHTLSHSRWIQILRSTVALHSRAAFC